MTLIADAVHPSHLKADFLLSERATFFQYILVSATFSTLTCNFSSPVYCMKERHGNLTLIAGISPIRTAQGLYQPSANAVCTCGCLARVSRVSAIMVPQ